MNARALEAIDRGEMPDFDSWEMEETDGGVRYVVLEAADATSPDGPTSSSPSSY